MADTGGKALYVIKRNGERESIHFDKITERLRVLCLMAPALPSEVEPVLVAQKVIQGVYSGIKTTELDTLAAETAAYMSTTHHGYGDLAARIAISNCQKETSNSFFEVMTLEYNHVNKKTGEAAPLLSDEIYNIILRNAGVIDQYIDYKRDFEYDYFGFRTLERSYLVRLNGRVVERPQHMLMRVAIGIHGNNLNMAFKTYDYMSQKWFTHATPTLFNAGTRNPQLSSCFLVTMKDDSIEGIYDTLKQTALISKSAGGIGLSIHNIRASHSYIKGTNGTSNGLVPMLRVFNDTARYVDQGGGKRKGAFAVYLEPWHADVFEFLDLKKPHGKDEFRARDLFFALWIPDLFMRRVEANGEWSLFCPNEAPGLCDVWGEEFETLYAQYEREGRARKTVKAQDLWFAMLESQIETGTPYVLFKDACNRKSNQQNLGTIRSSNLCTEIIEYSSADEVAVCNLASLSLPKFVKDGKFDHDKLYEVTGHVTCNLNRVIDINYYPIPEARTSNLRHRPIGIGVQGLADVFLKLRLPFDSDEAKALNREIFETIYFAALTTSKDLAIVEGPYSTFKGSPASHGTLQFDMWGATPTKRWNWTVLKEQIIKHGLRNSLLVAPMPTASTSQILGNQEASEPYTTNIYSRRVLAGEFTVLNKYLLDDLMKLSLWTPELKNQIIAERGSVQNIASIPDDIKALYKTVWEIKMRDLMDMAADRGAFIDQSQSFNCFMANPTSAKLSSMHFYGWKKGLKTGCYYLRTQNVVNAIQFTVDQRQLQRSRDGTTSAPGSPVAPASVPASTTRLLAHGVESTSPSPMVTPLQRRVVPSQSSVEERQKELRNRQFIMDPPIYKDDGRVVSGDQLQDYELPGNPPSDKETKRMLLQNNNFPPQPIQGEDPSLRMGTTASSKSYLMPMLERFLENTPSVDAVESEGKSTSAQGSGNQAAEFRTQLGCMPLPHILRVGPTAHGMSYVTPILRKVTTNPAPVTGVVDIREEAPDFFIPDKSATHQKVVTFQAPPSVESSPFDEISTDDSSPDAQLRTATKALHRQRKKAGGLGPFYASVNGQKYVLQGLSEQVWLPVCFADDLVATAAATTTEQTPTASYSSKKTVTFRDPPVEDGVGTKATIAIAVSSVQQLRDVFAGCTTMHRKLQLIENYANERASAARIGPVSMTPGDTSYDLLDVLGDVINAERKAVAAKAAAAAKPLTADPMPSDRAIGSDQLLSPIAYKATVHFGVPPTKFDPDYVQSEDSPSREEWDDAAMNAHNLRETTGGPGPFYTIVNGKKFVLTQRANPLLPIADNLRWFLEHVVPAVQTNSTTTATPVATEDEICTMQDGCLSCGS